ncbi:MAG: hypothetical protein ACYCW6_21330, partial [Candidatus Xenobia bacterium]
MNQTLTRPGKSWWIPADSPVTAEVAALKRALLQVTRPLALFDMPAGPALCHDGSMLSMAAENAYPMQ